MDYILEVLQKYRLQFELLDVISSALGIITWLIALPILIIAWRRSKIIRIKLFGIEATLERGIKAGTKIAAATEEKIGREEHFDHNFSSVTTTISNLIKSGELFALPKKSILWVDDKPENNKYETEAICALGIDVVTSRDTEDALQLLADPAFDLIISDMGRPSGERAGYDLLKAVRELGITTPFIIYSTAKRPEHVEEARLRGAQATTNDPRELLILVVELLTKRTP